MKIKSILTTMITAALVFSAAADSLTWGIYNGSQSLGYWGTGKSEAVSLMMQVDASSIVGSKVTAVRIPLNCSEMSGTAVFLSKETPSQSKGVATGDLLNVAFVAQKGWNEIVLAEPWTIDTETFYAGVTGKVNDLAVAGGNAPFVLAYDGAEGSCSVVSERTYRKWQDFAATQGLTLPMQFVLEGDVVKDFAVGLTRVMPAVSKYGEPVEINLTLSNHGVQPVESVAWSVELNGETTTGTSAVNISNEFYGLTASLKVQAAAIAVKGNYTGKVTITQVNGQPNTDLSASKPVSVTVMSNVPVKRPVMEEFTGCWCGWCPRGWLGLKLMNERYPEDFIGVSYHNGDAMEMCAESDFPVRIQGYPGANIDRCHDTDAYWGDTNNTPMGVEELWNKMRQESFTPANVLVEAQLNEDETCIELTATYQFCTSVADGHYGAAYLVTADGLTGTGKNWLQHSYYSGDEMYRDGLLDELVDAGGNIYLTFDDVLVAQSHVKGGSYTDVIPASVEDGEEISHSSSFELSKMVSSLDGSYLVQDKNKLNVIALMIDTESGAVVNAAKCHVVTAVDLGIETLRTERAQGVMYDLQGRVVKQAAKGQVVLSGNCKRIER